MFRIFHDYKERELWLGCQDRYHAISSQRVLSARLASAWTLTPASLVTSVSGSRDLSWSRGLRKVRVGGELLLVSIAEEGMTVSSLSEGETGNAHRGSQAARVIASLLGTSGDESHVSQGRWTRVSG